MIHKISERNKINSKGIEARVHRGGPKGTDVHYTELEASLGRTLYSHDMWERLKKNPDVTFLCEEAAEKSGLLKRAHEALWVDYDGCVPQAVDFEVGSQLICLNKRTKLPNIFGSAATLVEGSKFNRLLHSALLHLLNLLL